MIKAASASTFEVDDISLACAEIKAQIDEQLSLMRFSAGIVLCDPEFIEAGIMPSLYQALNIPLAGGTTVSSATNREVGLTMLSVLVLTSDDVWFAVSSTSGLEGGSVEAIRSSLRDALASELEPPRLFIAFPPIIDAVAGDDYIGAIESVCGAIPVFGALPLDDTLTDFSRSASIHNGLALKNEMSYIILFGNAHPRFYRATVPGDANLTKARAVATRAEGNILYEINGVPAVKYLESVGLAANGDLKAGAMWVPLLLTLPGAADDVPFVRALIRIDRDGSAVFRGRIYEGAEFSFGSNLGADVLDSTRDTVGQLLNENGVQAAILFSCMIRQLVIGSDPLQELRQLKDDISSNFPFIASYAGGEIAPTSVNHQTNQAQNRFHNYSFIACLL